MKITAAVTEALGAPFVLQDIDLEPPGPGEVMVKIVACGICHTDLGAVAGNYPMPFPAIFGHEGAGVVEAVGDGVSKVAPGDHVALSFNSCGFCHNCQHGGPAYCSAGFELNVIGKRPNGESAYSREGEELGGHFFSQSAFATYSIAAERNVVKIDRNVPLDVVAPLGCGIQTGAGAMLNTLGVTPAMQVAVLGTGSVGLAAVMGAALAGCRTIIAVDINPQRLELARELGATHCINSAEGDLSQALIEHCPGGLDGILDTTSIPQLLNASLMALTMRGTLMVGGAAKPGSTVTMDLPSIHYGRTVRGMLEGDSVPDTFIPELIGHYQAGRFPLEKLICYYNFEDINAAIADTASGKVVKPVLKMT